MRLTAVWWETSRDPSDGPNVLGNSRGANSSDACGNLE